MDRGQERLGGRGLGVPAGLDPPGRSGVGEAGELVGRRGAVRRELALDDDVERPGRVEAQLGAAPGEPRDEGGDVVGRGHVEATVAAELEHDPVGAQGAVERAHRRALGVPHADRPHRHVVADDGALHRLREELHLPGPHVRPLEREPLAGPRAVEIGERVVEQLGALAQRLRLTRHRGEPAVVEHADADRQHEATARQVVDGQRLAHDLPRLAAGEREDHRAQRDPLGPDRRRREHRPRVERVDRHGQQAQPVPREEPVPAGVLRLDRHLQHLGGGAEAPDHPDLDPCPRRRCAHPPDATRPHPHP